MLTFFFELCENNENGIQSDSEPEELETAVVHSQATTDTDTLSTPGVEKKECPLLSCVSIERAYQRHGIDYVKCNQPRCGTEFKLNPTTSTNLSRQCFFRTLYNRDSLGPKV